MRRGLLLYNGNVLTQADGVEADSIAMRSGRIVAVGRTLQHDPDFKGFSRCNLHGKTIIPGLVDAHTHIYYLALSLGRISLEGLTSLEACLRKIKRHADRLGRNEWVVGEGFAPSRFRPDRFMLDKVTGGRPAFLFSKDHHAAWVNSRALELAKIGPTTPEPKTGRIERLDGGRPNGLLYEDPAYDLWKLVPQPSRREIRRRWRKALDYAYRKGVTGVHSFDDAEAMEFFEEEAAKGRLGLRINYYPRHTILETLSTRRIHYGYGSDFYRVAGIKLFADGALGSQSALCFHRYAGSRDNYGIEVLSTREMKRFIRQAARLGFPCAIHGIGDRAVANILDAFETTARPSSGARHRIEHVQLIRRKDIPRLKRLGVVASMQPSHCPPDIPMIRKYWGERGRNAFLFRTLLDKGITLAFGSDAPIEPLDPLAGIAAAVRRSRKGHHDRFYPEQRLTAAEALFAFTVGPAVATGQAHCRGYLLPGYPADLVILREDITRIAAERLYDTPVLATIVDGKIRYCHSSLRL